MLLMPRETLCFEVVITLLNVLHMKHAMLGCKVFFIKKRGKKALLLLMDSLVLIQNYKD